ncbi:MAG: hypothetical protein R2778_03615 [Saprospiraceae bacterium]
MKHTRWKKGIIFGALDNQSIAWKVAERCVEEGAQIVLTNAPVAMRMGEINKLAENATHRLFLPMPLHWRIWKTCFRKVWNILVAKSILYFTLLACR